MHAENSNRDPNPSNLNLREKLKRAEQALRLSEGCHALVARGADDGLWDWNLKTNEIFFSIRWKSMLALEDSEIGDSPEEWLNRVHPEDIDRVKAQIASHLEGLTPHFVSEHRILHKDGNYRWVLSRGIAIRDAEGRASRVAGSQIDITDRRTAEERWQHDAFQDELTGLPSRALFIDHLGLSIWRTKRPGEYSFAVLFLGVDRFKLVNDSLGHMTGDELLIAIARRLKACLRPGATVSRFGGDEFAILLDDVQDVSNATRVADRIQKKLAAPFNLRGQEVFLTASIGIALEGAENERPEDVLLNAGMAMHRAKAHGRACYERFAVGMRADAVALLQLEGNLRRATERREFRLYFQPIASLEDGAITGAETLLRWQHPQRGLISPAEFVPLTEETGMIVVIGEWALRTACAQARAWHAAGHSDLRVTVNFSARQFEHPNFARLIRTVLKETGLAASALELEITESIAMKNVHCSGTTLSELSAHGIHISLDDFGTGFSSLRYLTRFPINTLKIDQTFVRDLTHDPADAAITAAVITMAHTLKLKVIAEGVETEEQLAFLCSRRCDEIQGYLFSRPVPAEAFTKLLQEERNLFNVKVRSSRAMGRHDAKFQPEGRI
jgi:diguanylate cyclase (GGDEF)-like protein/PAS domain S-box-containing protein